MQRNLCYTSLSSLTRPSEDTASSPILRIKLLLLPVRDVGGYWDVSQSISSYTVFSFLFRFVFGPYSSSSSSSDTSFTGAKVSVNFGSNLDAGFLFQGAFDTPETIDSSRRSPKAPY